VTITTKIINELLGYNIRIYFLWTQAKPKFVIGNQLEGNTVLRQHQYLHRDDIQYAKIIIHTKISNQLSLLQEMRDKSDLTKQSIQQLVSALELIDQVIDSWRLRWIEGNCAKFFFQWYFEQQWRYKREPRTRQDILNTLLDMGYHLIYCIVESHLCLYGFDIYKGVYHTMFFERKSLVCDLVEPLRYLIDRQIKNALNLGQIKAEDFKRVKHEYTLDRKKRNEIVKILLKPLIDHKMEIFASIKSFYSSMMSQQLDLYKPFRYMN
jgi:CRISPR-associated protein Cas1